jgi:hypothetical protein
MHAAGLGTLPCFLAFDEHEQIGVHLVLERRAQTVWGALLDRQCRAFDELGLDEAGAGDSHDLVVVAVQNERRHVDLLQVLGLIRLGERLMQKYAAGNPIIFPAAKMTRAPYQRPSRRGGCSRRTAA